MGLLKEGITEVIATTRKNAAPMGVRTRQGHHGMVLFKGSHTAENIIREGWVVANFVYDPVLYVRTAFEDLPIEYFTGEEVGGIEVFRLAAADAWVACTVSVVADRETTLTLALSVLSEEILHPSVYPVNRGFSSVIEATVHATRFVRGGDPGIGMLIRHHMGLITRCGGPREWEALSLLKGYLSSAPHTLPD
ncbi:MAG: DUF447 family protein [Methanomicrobiales archaeon]|nr:DUF447 family protein [Methanomicrobiales archaeon]